MKFLTFKGGIHPDDHKKATENIDITEIKPSKIMVYPMSQHIGAPCTPCVSVGDEVKLGQIIGESEAFVSAKIHSTVSGTVHPIPERGATFIPPFQILIHRRS